MALTAAQITTAYQNVLQRNPTTAEVNAWVNVSNSGALTDAQIIQSIVNSPEAINYTAATIRIYQAAFGRVPDKAGLDVNTDVLSAGNPVNALAGAFVMSQEFANKYNGGTLVQDNAAAVTDAFLQALYVNVLGRTGSAAEVSAWKALLTTPGSGYTKASDVLVGFSQSAEFVQKTAAPIQTFLTAAANGTAVYTGALFDPTSGTGSTFTLTTTAETINGSTGGDVINAFVNTSVGSTDSTLTGADQINGNAGTDQLNLSVSGTAGGALPAASITSVERFFIRDLAGAASTYNFGTVAGEEQVWSDRSTNAVTFDNIGTNAVVGVKGDGNVTNGATTFTMASATDAVNIAIDGGVKAGNITRNQTGATTVTVSSTGAANTIGTLDVDTGTAVTGLTINATTNLTATLAADYAANATLKIAGAASKVDLSGAALSANFKSVDASGLTAGGASVVLGANTTSYTGGAGADTVAVGGLVFNGSVKLDGGAGSADVISISDQAALTAATAANISNFEVLRITDDNDGAGDTFSASQLTGITNIQIDAISAGDAVTINNISAAQAANIQIRGSQAATGVPVLNVTGASTVGQLDTLTIAINDDATAKNTITVADITAAGVETVNFNATDNLTLSAMTGLTAVTAVNFTGGGNVSATTGALALNVNTVVDATALTGTFTFDATAATTNGLAIKGSTAGVNTLTGSAQADVVTGGNANDTLSGLAGNDTINGGAGNDNITGGAGADTLTGGAGTDTFVYTTLTDSVAATPDKVTDFVAGTDKFDVTTVPTSILQGANYTAAGTGTLATDIATALAAGGGTLTANSAMVVTITGTGAGTYLVINDGTAGYVGTDDAVINITGLTGTLTTADFV